MGNETLPPSPTPAGDTLPSEPLGIRLARAAKAALLALVHLILGALLVLLWVFPYLLRLAVVTAWGIGIWRAWQSVPPLIAPYPHGGMDGIAKALLVYLAGVPVIIAANIRFRGKDGRTWVWGGFLLGAGLMWGAVFGVPRWAQVNPALLFVSVPFLYFTSAAILLVKHKFEKEYSHV